MTSVQEWAEKVRIEYGKLTPVVMVEAARADGPDQCPVYDRFKFDDDATAAEQWRIETARHIIKSIRVTFRKAPRGKDRWIRAYHAVPDAAGPEPFRFERAKDVAVDPVLREIVLRDMEREWRALRARYGHMAEFVELVLSEVEADAA